MSTLAEEVGNQKLAAQYICRELRDADEANLVDEEGSLSILLKSYILQFYVLFNLMIVFVYMKVMYHSSF